MEINLSPSSLNCYLNSPLEYYFKYILKLPADTSVPSCYGEAGTLVHSLLEQSIKFKLLEPITETKFKNLWKEKELDKKKGMNNKPLEEEEYYQAYLIGLTRIKEYPQAVFSEKEIVADFYNDDKGNIIKLKGILDYVVGYLPEYLIIDWKTSSKPKPEHKTQALFYCYLLGTKKCIMDYIKIDKKVEHEFTEEELLQFEKDLFEIARDISNKGTDITKYEAGNWDNIYNENKEACRKEINRRKINTELLPIERKSFIYPDIDKQVLIVRQSCLNNAQAFSKDIDELIKNAKRLEQEYVWGND